MILSYDAFVYVCQKKIMIPDRSQPCHSVDLLSDDFDLAQHEYAASNIIYHPIHAFHKTLTCHCTTSSY